MASSKCLPVTFWVIDPYAVDLVADQRFMRFQCPCGMTSSRSARYPQTLCCSALDGSASGDTPITPRLVGPIRPRLTGGPVKPQLLSPIGPIKVMIAARTRRPGESCSQMAAVPPGPGPQPARCPKAPNPPLGPMKCTPGHNAIHITLEFSALRSDRRTDQAIGILDRRANQSDR